MTGPDIAISVEGLSKCYEIYDKPHHRLLQMISRGHRKFYNEFWALKDVSFQITRGRTVGILGRNGSGKSTLLKLICGTLHPTRGNIQTQGRIAAILELGSGFNPEFTGTENVYMKASILGLSDKEISKRFQSIADFAEIGEFLEQPIKTYSSGMVVRLAFAVAVNVDPEILVVDEALSVGDELYQRKCFSRIEEIREAGATVLFVSHSGNIILQLCDTAILLEQGELLAKGNPKQIYGVYQRLLYAPEEKKDNILQDIKMMEVSLPEMTKKKKVVLSSKIDQPDNNNQPCESYNPELIPSSTINYESRGAVIHSPEILTIQGKPVNELVRSRRYIYKYIVNFTKDVRNVKFGMMVKTKSGFELGGSVTAHSKINSISCINRGTTYTVCFEFCCALNQGSYFLNAGVTGEEEGIETFLHRLLDSAMFKVLPEKDRVTTAIVDFCCKTTFHKIKN